MARSLRRRGERRRSTVRSDRDGGVSGTQAVPARDDHAVASSGPHPILDEFAEDYERYAAQSPYNPLYDRPAVLELLGEEARSAGARCGVRAGPVFQGVLPGDRYDLAAASTQTLGEEAWRAHLAWGMERARQITIGTPVTSRVAVVTGDLLDRTRIEEVVRRAGLEPVTLADRAAVERALAESMPSVALVDLRVGEGERIIELLAAAGVEVTVFGPHVDEAALERARAAGAAEALPRSRFFSRLPHMYEARDNYQSTLE